MKTIAQNIPAWIAHNWTADHSLPPGTIELRDGAGRVLGRIENIGDLPNQGPTRIEILEGIARKAAASVMSPAWAGVCDEDVDLEQALLAAGFLQSRSLKTSTTLSGVHALPRQSSPSR